MEQHPESSLFTASCHPLLQPRYRTVFWLLLTRPSLFRRETHTCTYVFLADSTCNRIINHFRLLNAAAALFLPLRPRLTFFPFLLLFACEEDLLQRWLRFSKKKEKIMYISCSFGSSARCCRERKGLLICPVATFGVVASRLPGASCLVLVAESTAYVITTVFFFSQ